MKSLWHVSLAIYLFCNFKKHFLFFLFLSIKVKLSIYVQGVVRKYKKLDGNYTRMLKAILNKSWRQHPLKQQLYGHLPTIMKTIQVRRTGHAGQCWRSRDELMSDVLQWTPSHGWAKADDQLEPTYNSSVLIQDVALKTCRKQWTIKKGGEKWSGISVLMARHDDDD